MVGKLGTAVVSACRDHPRHEWVNYVLHRNRRSRVIGSNLVKALNERGESNIIAVDNLKFADKFRNLADCDIADYLDKEEFLGKTGRWIFRRFVDCGTASGRLFRYHGKRWPLHDEE
ncbi:MAG: hypothetical protein WDM70_07990 [Nitrosomonadales bacterium]